MADRNWIVQVCDVENGDEEIQTGVYGPMTKEEAEQWCERWTASRPFDYNLYVCQLRNPWTPEITNPQPEAFRFPSSLYDL